MPYTDEGQTPLTTQQLYQVQTTLIELARDAILVRDSGSWIFSWNKGAEKLYGWTASEAIGQVTHTLLQTRFPESLDALNDALAHEGVWEGELIHTCADGSQVVVESSQVLLRNEQEQPFAILEINRDITARKTEEERIAQQNAQLQQLNLDLQRSNQELQDFAYVASHDLQEPLRKIQAFGNLLQDEYGEALGDGDEYLKRMRQAATRMRVLIDDLLTFSRVTTHAQPFSPVDLKSIVSEVVDDLEVQIQATGGSVEIGDLPTLHADPLQMRQLFQNLIGNALKFHRRDVPPVVKVHAEMLPGSDDDDEALAGADWICRLFIEDNGIGFDEKYLDRIFTVFQRLHGKGAYEGTGIGLAVVRKIAERHGGTVTAQSTVGTGSTFIITLPAQKTQVAYLLDEENTHE